MPTQPLQLNAVTVDILFDSMPYVVFLFHARPCFCEPCTLLEKSVNFTFICLLRMRASGMPNEQVRSWKFTLKREPSAAHNKHFQVKRGKLRQIFARKNLVTTILLPFYYHFFSLQKQIVHNVANRGKSRLFMLPVTNNVCLLSGYVQSSHGEK